MALPDNIHVFPFEWEFRGQTMLLYPVGIELDDGLLLIDTGLPHTVEEILTQVEAAGFSMSDITMVLITHQDVDHAGGLAHLCSRADPVVLASAQAADVIEGRTMPRVGESGRYPPARVDIEVPSDVVVNTRAGPVRVIKTPGHTPDHISLYLPEEQLLIAGDALTLHGDILNAPDASVSMDPDLARDSIGRLATLAIDQVLCYHGGLTDQGTARLAKIADTG